MQLPTTEQELDTFIEDQERKLTVIDTLATQMGVSRHDLIAWLNDEPQRVN